MRLTQKAFDTHTQYYTPTPRPILHQEVHGFNDPNLYRILAITDDYEIRSLNGKQALVGNSRVYEFLPSGTYPDLAPSIERFEIALRKTRHYNKRLKGALND